MIACSCTKPNFSQVDCINVNYMEQSYQDSTGLYPIGEPKVIWPQDKQAPILCGAEANKARNFKPKWEQLCDAEGTKYWVKLYVKIY